MRIKGKIINERKSELKHRIERIMDKNGEHTEACNMYAPLQTNY